MSELKSENGQRDQSSAPRVGVRLMIMILIGLMLMAIYANVQRFRRDKIESVTVTPAATATPSPAH
jgi:hypothetical protein